MQYSISIAVQLKENCIESFKFAMQYYSEHDRPGIDAPWKNLLFSEIIIDEGGWIHVNWNQSIEWDTNYGDDFGIFIIPFVKKGEMSYQNFSNGKRIIKYFGNNRAHIKGFENETLDFEDELETKWDFFYIPIIKYLVLTIITEEMRNSDFINLTKNENEIRKQGDLIEELIYGFIGRELLHGIIDEQNKIFHVNKRVENDIHLCIHCQEKTHADDRFCAFCGMKQ